MIDDESNLMFYVEKNSLTMRNLRLDTIDRIPLDLKQPLMCHIFLTDHEIFVSSSWFDHLIVISRKDFSRKTIELDFQIFQVCAEERYIFISSPIGSTRIEIKKYLKKDFLSSRVHCVQKIIIETGFLDMTIHGDSLVLYRSWPSEIVLLSIENFAEKLRVKIPELPTCSYIVSYRNSVYITTFYNGTMFLLK